MSRAVVTNAEGRDEDAAEEHAEEWLTVTQAARRLGISERAVRKKVERGNVEARRAGDGNRIRLEVRLPAGNHTKGRVEGHAEDYAEEVARTLQAEVQNLRAELERERNQVEDLRSRMEVLRTERDGARIEAAELRGRLAEATRPGPLGRLLDAVTARLSGRRSS
jgi:excisionase family DNA binding protein